MYQVSIEVMTDSRLQRKSEKIYAYALTIRGKDGKEKGVIGVGTVNGTYHCATLTAANEAIRRLNQNCIVAVTTEDAFVASRINILREMQERKTPMTSEPGAANQEEWEGLQRHMHHNKIYGWMDPLKHKDKLAKAIEEQKGVRNVG